MNDAASQVRTRKGEDGFLYQVNEAFAPHGEALLARIASNGPTKDAAVIKRNMVRTVYRLEAEGLELFLKIYHNPGIGEAVKSFLVPSRARREWEAMRRLADLGIATASAVLLGERRKAGRLTGACFAATAVQGAVPFGRFVEKALLEDRWDERMKTAVYHRLARLTARLHAREVRHGDFHLGNLLVRLDANGEPEVYLIDLHTVSFPRRLARRWKILNLARVAEVLAGMDGGRDLDLFLARYLDAVPGFSPGLTELRAEVEHRLARLRIRKLSSRTRRCLLKSSEFQPASAGGYRMHIRRSVLTPELALKAIEEHDRVSGVWTGCADPTTLPRMLHPLFKNKVTAVAVAGDEGEIPLFVKEYRPREPWRNRLAAFGLGIPLHRPLLRALFFLLRRKDACISEGERSWIAGRGLEVRGIETPETAAWIRGKGREFFMTRLFEGGERLYEFLERRCKTADPREAARLQARMAVELALLVRRLHDLGGRHSDLSEQNILVREEAGERKYQFIDLDTLSFSKRVNERERFRNLVQLGHLPGGANVLAKARFLQIYLGNGKNQRWRALLRRLNQDILKRMDRKRKKFARLGSEDPHPSPSRLKANW